VQQQDEARLHEDEQRRGDDDGGGCVRLASGLVGDPGVQPEVDGAEDDAGPEQDDGDLELFCTVVHGGPLKKAVAFLKKSSAKNF